MVQRLRRHALLLVQVARKVRDPDLTAEIQVLAIEILTSAAKLERYYFASDTRKSA
jgi:hypothetical protein